MICIMDNLNLVLQQLDCYVISSLSIKPTSLLKHMFLVFPSHGFASSTIVSSTIPVQTVFHNIVESIAVNR